MPINFKGIPRREPIDGEFWRLVDWQNDQYGWFNVSGGGGGGAPNEYDLTNATQWSVAHGRLYYPDVYILDAGNNLVYMTVQYPDALTIYLNFPQPFTGKVLVL